MSYRKSKVFLCELCVKSCSDIMFTACTSAGSIIYVHTNNAVMNIITYIKVEPKSYLCTASLHGFLLLGTTVSEDCGYCHSVVALHFCAMPCVILQLHLFSICTCNIFFVDFQVDSLIQFICVANDTCKIVFQIQGSKLL